MNEHLSDITIQHLTLGELHALCHELGVEYGTLRAKNSAAKARELFALMRAQGRLGELAEAIQPKQPQPALRIERTKPYERPMLLTLAAPLIIVAAIILVALLATVSGGKEGVQPTSIAPIRQQVRMEPSPAPATPTPSPMPVLTGQYAISYADAASWLETLLPEDHDAQILDWAMWGLAGLLELDAKTLRNAFYDQAMLRDLAFEGLAVYRVGAGRGFADASGTLHLLAPAATTGAPRAIGMVLDDYRKDAGADPAQVLIYRYEIDGEGQQVILTPDEFRPVEAVRQAHGYREMQVDSQAALQRFLSETQHLSCLELRQGQLWAGGWHWPDSPAGQVTAEDLTALQRGYRRAVQGLSPEPGFSLDAGEPMTVADLLELLDPARYPKLARYKQEVAAFVAEWRQADTEQAQSRVVQGHRDLVQNLLDDDEYLQLLEFLMHTAEGKPPYQKARYDGGLQGTEAGMTYFYTDIVAKAWRMEKGSGVPAGLVPGFVSDMQAPIPWGHCTFEEESGRLWFGLREGAISIHDTRIDLGSLTTRVFTLVKDPVGGDQEIEPSYSFGRMVWWWDRHYLDMADYEPQYHRLDQLMRWGAATAWLVEKDVMLLPELPEAEVTNDWQFAAWLAAHPELKWHFDVPFVEPPGETTEALLTLYSESFQQCGQDWILSGGISNPPIERIIIIEESRPDLSPEVARAGLREAGTTFSSATQSGTVANLDGTLRRTLNPVEGNAARVDTRADGRKVWSLGEIKVWVSESAPREIGFRFSSESGRIGQALDIQHVTLGELSATTEGTLASIHWQPGTLDRARRFFASLQEALPGRSLLAAVTAAGKTTPVHTEPGDERVLVQLCAAAEPCWFAIEEGLLPANDGIAFRLGVPSEDEPVWYTAYPSQPPE